MPQTALGAPMKTCVQEKESASLSLSLVTYTVNVAQVTQDDIVKSLMLVPWIHASVATVQTLLVATVRRSTVPVNLGILVNDVILISMNVTCQETRMPVKMVDFVMMLSTPMFVSAVTAFMATIVNSYPTCVTTSDHVETMQTVAELVL
jgi:hypothetical protein